MTSLRSGASGAPGPAPSSSVQDYPDDEAAWSLTKTAIVSPLDGGAGQRISVAAAFMLSMPVPSPWPGPSR